MKKWVKRMPASGNISCRMPQMWRALQQAGKAERNGTSFLRSETAASGAKRPDA
ncbi:MAG TPA: hypothetical protein PLO67_22215 [Saprospiraceae bacterium]|nr:hypothetical protein [Saprospiraceae bacterium]